MHSDRPNITLNLGAGAARGFAHIGVMRALIEARIPFDMVIGVSMGAMVGAIYAMHPDINFTEERMVEMLESHEFQETIIASYYRTMSDHKMTFWQKVNAMYKKTGLVGKIFLSPGMMTHEEIEEVLIHFLPQTDIKLLRFPFGCIAVDLDKGVSRLFRSGPLRKLVTASMSMPVVFPPVPYEHGHYVDGGVLDKIGIQGALDIKVRKIIAVDVSNMDFPQKLVKTGVDVMLRTEEIASFHRRINQLNKADVVIQPIHGNIHWADYSMAREIMVMGYDTTRSMIPEIRHGLKLTNPFRRFFTIFRKNIKNSYT